MYYIFQGHPPVYVVINVERGGGPRTGARVRREREKENTTTTTGAAVHDNVFRTPARDRRKKHAARIRCGGENPLKNVNVCIHTMHTKRSSVVVPVGTQ